MSVNDLLEPWTVLDNALGLAGPIRDEAHYEELLAFVGECFDRFAGQEGHPVFGLVSIVADRIREYEDRVHPWPDESTPETTLAFLMEQHGIKQSELPEVGAQSVVSEILSGKRKINARQAKALAARFGVEVGAFL